MPIAPTDIWSLQGSWNGLLVVMNAAREFGGAIYSLQWGGFEFIDHTDHGRCLQTAWQLDGNGEGENPTEAGASADMTSSSTVVKSATVAGNALGTTAQLAYWVPYGGQATSPHVLSKSVTLNDNMLRHRIVIELADDHKDMFIEGLTGYLPASFTRWLAFDPAAGTCAELPAPVGEVTSLLPIIACIADGSKALALYHTGAAMRYLYGMPEGCPKLDCAWFTVPDAKAGTYSWDAFTAFGTLDQVTAALIGLVRDHPSQP